MNVRFDSAAPVVPAGALGRVHFIAIGGAGMSAVARIMLARGIPVRGSDARRSALTDSLSEQGARVHIGHDERNVRDADTVVVSSAIRDDNVELLAARARGLRVLHRSQALAALMAGTRKVAVAGANGKTTTTAMLTVALQGAGLDPSYAIGGELVSPAHPSATNAHWGTADVFVVEADESDGSFLAYQPDVAVVTNVQPDHLDHYGTFAAVQDAYAAFAGSVRPGGLLVCCADDPGSRSLADRVRVDGGRVLTYGESPDADVRVRDARPDGMSSVAELELRDQPGASHGLRIHMPGRHNLLNAAAAFTAATAGVGAEPEGVLSGLAGFSGTRRRFEVKGESGGVRVVDDYAHNPGKVAAVVETAAALAVPGRLLVVFQPHLYSRTRDFAAQFAAALAPADVVVVTDVYAAREDPLPGVTGELVVEHLRRSPPAAGSTAGPQARYLPDWRQAAGFLAERVRPGDLVMTVGAGDVTGLGPMLLEVLDRQSATSSERRQMGTGPTPEGRAPESRRPDNVKEH